MPKYKMIVLTNAATGKDAEFADWYDNLHLQQVANIEGFSSAQRFRLLHPVGDNGTSYNSLAIYELETDDCQAAVAALQSSSGTENLVVSEALDTENLIAAVYEECTPVVLSK